MQRCHARTCSSFDRRRVVSSLDVRLHVEQTQGKMLLQSDVRNLRLKHSKIEQDDITKVEQFINSLNESGGDVAFVLDESTGVFQYLVYISSSMENLISRYPEVLIMDATYKTHLYLLPLLTIMCHDHNGADHLVLHAFIRHEDKTILGTCLDFLVDRYDSSQTRTIYLWTKLKVHCSNSFQGLKCLSFIFLSNENKCNITGASPRYSHV